MVGVSNSITSYSRKQQRWEHYHKFKNKQTNKTLVQRKLVWSSEEEKNIHELFNTHVLEEHIFRNVLRNVFRNVMVIILCKVFVCYVRTPSLGEEHISVSSKISVVTLSRGCGCVWWQPWRVAGISVVESSHLMWWSLCIMCVMYKNKPSC